MIESRGYESNPHVTDNTDLLRAKRNLVELRLEIIVVLVWGFRDLSACYGYQFYCYVPIFS